ncbi:MAG: serine hydrolase [Gammaproteobacteria bacterium]
MNDSEPSLTEAERQATLVDLMSARSGIYHSAHYETGGWKRAKALMAANGGHAPGATWLYNNWDFNTLGSILEAQVGESMGVAFSRRIARPTRMQDFTPAAVSYVGDESYAERMQGNHSNFPAYMFEMSVRDLARFGLLYLNCGRWEGTQVIPRKWVLESVTGRPVADGAPPGVEFFEEIGDYGYMWWVDKPGSRTWPAVRTEAPVYFGQGANGHFLWIAPYLDLVVVHQVATPGGLSTFDQLRRRFLGQPTVADNEFQEFLRRVLAAHPKAVDETGP